MPGRRDSDSPTFWSGYWPMASADTVSWMASDARLKSIARICDSNWPRTSMASKFTASGAAAVLSAGGRGAGTSWPMAPPAAVRARVVTMARCSGWRLVTAGDSKCDRWVPTVFPACFNPVTAVTWPPRARLFSMKIVEVRHPLVQHKLGLMRRVDNSTKTFRELTGEVAALLTYEATADLECEDAEVEGWAGPVRVRRIKGRKVTLVPILRAGLGMLHGVLELIPAAKVGVVGIKRDESTLQAV